MKATQTLSVPTALYQLPATRRHFFLTLVRCALAIIASVVLIRPLSAQVLVNGANQDGTIAINATNFYTFTATNGDTIVLRCGKLSGSGPFGPWIRLYGPNNALLSQDFNASDAYLTYRAVTNGTFTVAIASLTAGQTGTFRLRFFKIPGTFTVSPGDEG